MIGVIPADAAMLLISDGRTVHRPDGNAPPASYLTGDS
jgi:hypothetical protein